MKRILFAFVFCLLPFASAYAQIPTCTQALAASPQGPFPCSVTASWTDNSDNEQGFRLYRRLNSGAWGQLGGNLAPNTNSVIDATLQQSATVDNVYDYRVEAFNSAGVAPGGNPVTASFTIPKAVAPAKPPTGITITFTGGTGELACSTCSGPDQKVNFNNDDGVFTLTAASHINISIQPRP